MNREISIIKDTINLLNLDLTGLTVLTECGTGHFQYLPIIAGLSNASHVNVYIKDTIYGSCDDIENNLLKLINENQIKTKIKIYKNNLDPSAFKNIDIITNSGMLRPLDKQKLSNVGNYNTVIPLMYEKWELRESDIDVDFCNLNKIRLGGTWENFPKLNIFEFCEPLILKIIFNAGYEIKENKCIIFSSDNFGHLAKKGIEKLGGKVIYMGVDIESIYNHIDDVDFILFADYLNKENLITNESSLFDIDLILRKNKNIGIIHLAGKIDLDLVVRKNGRISPFKEGMPVKMTETLSYLGDIPTLRLLVAGLKVGQCLSQNIDSDLVQIL
jgi:hypothetical protein